jgi:uncharacterized protein (DUF169 family)
MTDYRKIEQQLSEHLRLERRPVAIAFLDAAPTGVPKFSGTVPSACSFWRLASEGQTFYAMPSDHYNCPIGAYTHNIPLPPDRAAELPDTLRLMSQVGYIRMEEVPGIPRLSKEPAAIVYSPLGETPLDPDVVLFIGRPSRVMLLHEAAIRAGISMQVNTLARPTCMALPASLASGLVMSTACVGNRVYTDLDESDLYVAAPGKDLVRLAGEAQTIAAANAALLDYHTDRRHKLATV